MSKRIINFYEILGVKPTANDNQIRIAYGEKLREYRQDKKNKTTKDFKRLAQAYRILSDENERELYDRELEYYLEDQALEDEEVMPTSRFEEAYCKYKALKGREKQAHDIRHGEAEKFLNEKYQYANDISTRLKKGTLHIAGETFYKLQCLGIRNKDNITKYVFRNRKVIGIILASGIVLGGISIAKNIRNDEQPKTGQTTSTLTDYTFNKTYEVQFGDTLSELSEQFDVDQDDIRRANKALENTTLLQEGYTLKIPYTISTDNLEEFVDVVDIGDLTVKELANEYNTDCQTLYELNNGNIDFDYETKQYVTTKEQLLVPEFDEIIKKHK